MGQGVSLIGSWRTRIAMSWLVFQLARKEGIVNAATVLGVVNFVSNLPMFVLGPFGGVIVDRFSRQRVIILTQVLAMVQSGTLAVLTLGDWITIPQIVALEI